MSSENNSCPHLEPMLKRLLESDAVAAPTATDLRHAETCSQCREAIQNVAGMEDTVQGFFGDIKAALPPEPAGPALQRELAGPLRPWPIILGLLAALGLALLVFLPQVKPPPTTPAVTPPPVTAPPPAAPPQLLLAQGTIRFENGTAVKTGEALPAPASRFAAAGPALVQYGDLVAVSLVAEDATLATGTLGLQAGRVEIEIRKKGTPFQVKTPAATIGALGTLFSVDVAAGGETLVELTRGVIEINTIAGARQVLRTPSKRRIGASGSFLSDSPTLSSASEPASPPDLPAEAATAAVNDPDHPGDSAGSDTPGLSSRNWQFLIDTAERGQIDLLRRYVSSGANINVQNEEGNSPLHQSIRNGHEDVAVLLWQNGANPDLTNKYGETPKMLAEKKGLTTLLSLMGGRKQ